MRFQLTETKDGSFTVFDVEAGECFKSRHAARLESEVVFFGPGIRQNPWFGRVSPFRVLELGFGLGSNAAQLRATGEAIELVSIDRDYSGAHFFAQHLKDLWLEELLEKRQIRENRFSLKLLEGDFFKVLPGLKEKFHAIFFDPFSPKANPEAWSEKLFGLAHAILEPEGRLVTYSVSRLAKDNAQKAGFRIEKLRLPLELQKKSSLIAIKIS